MASLCVPGSRSLRRRRGIFQEKRRGLESIAEVDEEGSALALDVDQLEELKKVSDLAPRTSSSLAPDDWLAPTLPIDCGP